MKERVVDLYEQMNAPLLAYLRSLGLFDNDAGDVIQESFLRLLNHLMAGRPDGNLRAWIFQVAYGQAMDVHRFDTRFSSLGIRIKSGRDRGNDIGDLVYRDTRWRMSESRSRSRSTTEFRTHERQ